MRTFSYLFTTHVVDQMRERGIEEQEVRLTVETGVLRQVSDNRAVRGRVFTLGYNLGGQEYPHKEVTVVYTIEDSNIVVITAIARYGMFPGV